MKKHLIVAAGMLGAITMAAHADFLYPQFTYGPGYITQTVNYGPKTYSLDEFSAVFNQYNGMGTLTQVVARVTLDADNYLIELDNDNPTATKNLTVQLGAQNDTTLMSGDISSLYATQSFYPVKLLADDSDGAGLQTGGTDYAKYEVHGLSAESTTTYNTGLGSFIGSGTYSWYSSISGIASVNDNNSLTKYQQFGTWSGVLQITYKYEAAIPEPATLSVLALAGAALVVRRRRLRHSPA